ncbi:hypothetical protein [Pseudoduganella buxea]|uniref:Uncharacterized protein n=2 Tax=Pseudoduganella buxea TaxID=1949069 RepID=A0ABQ1KW44_9BURK|nr:hypothetical protein [Pseudoduganella buxea]GGC07490.1 hypothetical protein GCM10011572_31420 [Pseudoduganella buxea]
MLPIQPVGDRPGLAPLHGASAAPAATPAPPGIAVDVSPLGQLLGTLALAQKRIDGLGATPAGLGPAADLAQLGIAAGEVAEAFNLGRALAVPEQGAAGTALADRLTQALASQQDALRRIGIDTAADTAGSRLDVDSGRLLSAFAADRSGTLSTLRRAAASFAGTGDALQTPAPDVTDKTPITGAPAMPAPQPPLSQAPTQPGAPQPKPAGTLPTDATDPANPTNPAAPDQAAVNMAADAAAAQARQQLALDEEADRAAAALEADTLARRQLDSERQAARVEEARRQALLAEQMATERLARQRSEEIAREDAIRQAQRQMQLQAATDLASASQAALTQQSRQAAYRLDVARQVASEQVAAQQDGQDQRVTQDQRLMEARTAALRQLTSSQEQDLAAQALADRMDQQRREAAAAALTDSERQAQERLMAARRAAAGLPGADQPPDRQRADEALRAQERERDLARVHARDTATRRDDLLAGGVSARADIGRTDVTVPARTEPVQGTLASMEDVLRQGQDDGVRQEAAAARAAEANRANAANSPVAPNAADPAVQAAIAAQRLSGGVPGGAGGPAPAPPPRVEPVPAVRPVARVANVPALEGQGTPPRRGA